MLITQGTYTHVHAEAHKLNKHTHTHIHNSVLFMVEGIGRHRGINNTQRKKLKSFIYMHKYEINI